MQKKTRSFTYILFISFCAVTLLILLVSPLGITRHQLQNRIFTIENIDIAPQEDMFYVTLDISARSWYPWNVTVDCVRFKSMGEVNMMMDELTTDALPLDLSFGKKQTFSASFAFDFTRFQHETVLPETASSYEEYAQSLLRSVGLVFESNDLPTGEALCMNWNS